MKHTRIFKSANTIENQFIDRNPYQTRKSNNRPIRILISWLLTLGFSLGQIIGLSSQTFGEPATAQNQLITIGILSFQDESGSNAAPEVGQKLAQELRTKLLATFKDVLPKLINNGAAPTDALTVDQLQALGKQNNLKFIVRGGLLSLTAESANGEAKSDVHLYADIITVESSAMNSVRAQGSSTQPGATSNQSIELNGINFASGDFRKSPVGQAFSAAFEQLASLIYQSLTTPQDNPQANAQPPAPADVNSSGGQAIPTQIDATKAAETDEELQQLIAQAESLVSGGSGISTESLNSINQAVKNLKSAFDAKARLLEQAQDTVSADQEIQSRKQELQSAISTATQQVATVDPATGSQQPATQQPSGEKKNLMASIGGYLSDALGIMQKIQEMRALLRSGNDRSGYNQPSGTDSGNVPYTPDNSTTPIEELTTEVNGVVTDAGNPVDGATVTEPETGATATTDSNGAYNLRGIAAGRLAQLIISKAGKQIGSGQIDLVKGRTAVADFDVKPQANGSAVSSLRIIPATVMVNALKVQGQNTGILKGQIRDPQGQPVARALVSIKGLAVARTDSQGHYTFLNVPAGNHQLTIQKSGLVLKSQQVQIIAKRSNESPVQFAASDRIIKDPVKTSIITRGAGATLRGRIVDLDKQPVGSAKVTALLQTSAVTVYSNEKGKFEFQDLKPGQYRVLVSKPGFDNSSRIIELSVGESEAFEAQLKPTSSQVAIKVIQAQRARISAPTNQPNNNTTNRQPVANHPQEVAKGQLTGRIVDAQSGKPVPGAIISLQGQPAARTDVSGNYSVANLAQGNYRLNITRAGFFEINKTTAIRAGNLTREDFSLRLERQVDARVDVNNNRVQPNTPARTGQLRGQILDAKTGKPLQGASILISNQAVATTNQDGLFQVANLQAGNYQIAVKRNGYADAVGSVSIRPGEVSTAGIRLNPRAALILPPRR
jgi:protocatechuate 3,4-dioxygenase beta subunit